MKTKFLKITLALIALAITLPAMADVYVSWRETSKTNAATGTPVAISATSKPFRRATVYGRKDVRTANTGSVYLGSTATNDTQMVEVPAGGAVVLEPPPGYYQDLKDIYLDVGTANDGVWIIYEY